MISKRSLSKVLNFRVHQLSEYSEKFKESLNVYLGQITRSARMWTEESEDCGHQQFLEVSVPLEQAMMMLMEMTSHIENNMASQPLGAYSARPALTSLTDSLPQTVVEAQGLDQSLRSLLERLEAFQSVTDIVEDLRTDLDAHKRKINSMEGMTLQQKLDQYKNNQSSKIQKLDKKVSKLVQTLNKTDSRVKEMTGVVNTLKEQFTTSMRSLSGSEDESPAAVEKRSNRSYRSCYSEYGLYPDDTTGIDPEERLRMMESKLRELEIASRQIKSWIIDQELVENEKRSNDFKEVQEKLSVLEAEVSNLKDSNPGCLNGSVQSAEEGGRVLSAEGSGQSAEEGMRVPSAEGSGQSAEEGGRVPSAEESGSGQSAKEDGSVHSVEDRKQIVSVESTVPSEISTAKGNETTSKNKWTGFCVRCTYEIRTVSQSDPIPWDILSTGTSNGFNNKTGTFTAPEDGVYFVIFVHCQFGIKPTTIRLVLSEEIGRFEKTMITTSTADRYDYSFGQRQIIMNAGDILFLSLPKHGCRYQIPFFSCILVE